ncbi:Phage P2 baseplate assembly protein gpV [Yokenella regensburgei]|nr:Phage P2 baseplate assembly protein gpV [Yokenella regensburgei]
MDLAEVIRLLENIVRTGTVTEIDEEKWRVRVKSGRAGFHLAALECTACRRFQLLGAAVCWRAGMVPVPWG